MAMTSTTWPPLGRSLWPATLGAEEQGIVLSGKYADDAKPGSLRNRTGIIAHAQRLPSVLTSCEPTGCPLVLGGDCSILVAAGLALPRAPGRYGLVHLDGHTDFRNPGNSDQCASLAGDRRHRRACPYFFPVDVAHVGCRDDDEELQETRALLGAVIPLSQVRHQGVEEAARRIMNVADRADLDGYWVHLDVDILDPGVMPSVDSSDPGGLDPAELTELLAALAPRANGAQVTVFDPDLDPDGSNARLLTESSSPVSPRSAAIANEVSSLPPSCLVHIVHGQQATTDVEELPGTFRGAVLYCSADECGCAGRSLRRPGTNCSTG
jgi:arginase